MHFNVHYEYIHKGHKEKCYKSIFYKCRIVVVTCVVIPIYMHRIDSDPCANSKVFNYFPPTRWMHTSVSFQSRSETVTEINCAVSSNCTVISLGLM